jgi:hypothetical protein
MRGRIRLPALAPSKPRALRRVMDNMVILFFQIDGRKPGAITLIFRSVGFVTAA